MCNVGCAVAPQPCYDYSAAHVCTVGRAVKRNALFTRPPPRSFAVERNLLLTRCVAEAGALRLPRFSSLQTLTPGWDFNRSLEGVVLPIGLRRVTVAQSSTRAWKARAGLRIFTCNYAFDQNLEGLMVLRGLQSFGY